jgi:hypothetical protein
MGLARAPSLTPIDLSATEHGILGQDPTCPPSRDHKRPNTLSTLNRTAFLHCTKRRQGLKDRRTENAVSRLVAQSSYEGILDVKENTENRF